MQRREEATTASRIIGELAHELERYDSGFAKTACRQLRTTEALLDEVIEDVPEDADWGETLAKL
jgi:hypothetical protein